MPGTVLKLFYHLSVQIKVFHMLNNFKIVNLFLQMYPLLERISPRTRKLELFARMHNTHAGLVLNFHDSFFGSFLMVFLKLFDWGRLLSGFEMSLDAM